MSKAALTTCSTITKRYFGKSAAKVTYYDQAIVQSYKSLYNGQNYIPCGFMFKAFEDKGIAAAFNKSKSKDTKLKIMDVACGTGSYIRRISSLNISDYILGVDVSQEMVDEAKASVAVKHEMDVDFMTFDAFELVNKTELHDKFDVVNATWLYNYTRDQNELSSMMNGIYKCLKKGGIHTGITINPDVCGDSEQSYAKYGISMFANQYAGYKPSGDGPVSLRCLLKVTNEDEIVLNAHWYSGKTYYNSFKAAGFQEIQLLHPSQWHIHDEVNTMNVLERSLWTEFSNYNANCIAFSMTKN